MSGMSTILRDEAVKAAWIMEVSESDTPTEIRLEVEARPQYFAKDATPNLPCAPNTIPTCTWWWDNVNGEIPCEHMPFERGMSTEDVLRWNPSITAYCGNYLTGPSYCVEAPILQHAPTDDNGSQLHDWNPSVGTDCSGLWANSYVCISVIGHNPGTTTATVPPPTTTAPGPSPTQPGLVTTCTSFYKVQAGDTCQTIAQQKYPYINSVTLFTRWNPAVGSNCDNLLNGYYYCIPTELHQPMPGIINTCKRYYEQQYGITAAQFTRWNPLVGSSCGSLWERYFFCIGV
ncbi:hypothetical protein BJX99DRAFT_249450 [Aspergillus californicus]